MHVCVLALSVVMVVIAIALRIRTIRTTALQQTFSAFFDLLFVFRFDLLFGVKTKPYDNSNTLNVAYTVSSYSNLKVY